MNYEDLLKNAPPHDTNDFLRYLREHNPVLNESDDWLVIKNFKYGHPTAFAKIKFAGIYELLMWYGDREWHVKPKDERSVSRFHIHIL